MQTFSQHSPFTDSAAPAGRPGQPPGLPGSDPAPAPGSASQPAGAKAGEPTGAGSAAPTVPPDATMTSWRQPQQPRMLGTPPGAPPDTSSSLQGAILGKPSAEGGIMPPGFPGFANGESGKPADNPFDHDWSPRNPDGSLSSMKLEQIPSAPQAPQAPPNLSDPSTWMSMVHDNAQRGAWVKEQLAAAGRDTPANEEYYSKKVLGQPGANPTEQAGSAGYWADLMKHPRQDQPKPISPLQTAIGGTPTQSNMLNATGNDNPLLNALRQQLGQQRQVQ